MTEILMLTYSTRQTLNKSCTLLIKCLSVFRVSLTLSLRAPEVLLEAEGAILGSWACPVV